MDDRLTPDDLDNLLSALDGDLRRDETARWASEEMKKAWHAKVAALSEKLVRLKASQT